MHQYFRRGRILLFFAGVLGLTACGGSGGGNGNDNGGTTAYDCDGEGSVNVSGTISYEFVPAVSTGSGTRLDYAGSDARPVRQAEVEARCPDGSAVYASATTDDNGQYALAIPADVDLVIRARARLARQGAPGWEVRVVDNTSGQATWSAEGDVIGKDEVDGDIEVNLHAGSGWGGNGYSGNRVAGPFAILDSVYTAMQRVLEADPAAVFPELKLNWSPSNTDACASSFADYPFPDGCIGTSFFVNMLQSGGRNIFILGEEDSDTDEYDNHVVIHEWGHYYEDAFSRSDSLGGRHGAGDRLDMRVAFGEGWGNAWSGIATNDPLYVDTYGSSQAQGFSIDVENETTGNPGWWSETTVQAVIYDLYDAPDDDPVELGFGPIHSVLVNEQRTGDAMTSILSLISYLKDDVSVAEASAIDQMLADMHDISTINDPWGDDRTVMDDGSEFSAQQYVTPIHAELSVSEGTSHSVCSTNRFRAGSGGNFTEYNRLASRRFVRFEVDAGGAWLIRLDGSAGDLDDSDPDFYVYEQGRIIAAGEDYSSIDATGSGDEGTRAETETVTLEAGRTYVLEAMDWFNVDDDAGTGGDICHELTFETA